MNRMEREKERASFTKIEELLIREDDDCPIPRGIEDDSSAEMHQRVIHRRVDLRQKRFFILNMLDSREIRGFQSGKDAHYEKRSRRK